MGYAREELNEEIRSIEDAATLGKVEAFVRGMKAERAIAERGGDEKLELSASQSKRSSKREG